MFETRRRPGQKHACETKRAIEAKEGLGAAVPHRAVASQLPVSSVGCEGEVCKIKKGAASPYLTPRDSQVSVHQVIDIGVLTHIVLGHRPYYLLKSHCLEGDSVGYDCLRELRYLFAMFGGLHTGRFVPEIDQTKAAPPVRMFQAKNMLQQLAGVESFERVIARTQLPPQSLASREAFPDPFFPKVRPF